MRAVFVELLKKTPKDKKRKVCKQCHELNHAINSVDCKVNIQKKNSLRAKIKKYLLSQDCLQEKNNEDQLDNLSNLLGITPSTCKSLYMEIDPIVWIQRRMDLDNYKMEINRQSIPCFDCNSPILTVHLGSGRIWKGNTLCDPCWCKYSDVRKQMWIDVKNYRRVQCTICDVIQNHKEERFHFDHVNMFDKSNSIWSMINDGTDLQCIYREIDKCQIVCFSCHHQITDIERKIGFTRIKQMLSRKLNSDEITQVQYDEAINVFQQLYEQKMNSVYEGLKNKKTKNNP